MRTLRQAFSASLLFVALLTPLAHVSADGSADEISEGVKDGLASLRRGDFGDAYNTLEPLAIAGDDNAQNLLGIMYLEGTGVSQNPYEAVRLFRLSADQGNKRSQWQLGKALLIGAGAQQDEVEGLKYLEMAARQGVAKAQVALGILYSPAMKEGDVGLPGVLISSNNAPLLGQRIPKNSIASAFWFRQAAEQGDPEGQYNLALAYEDGLGVPLSLTEAVRLYQSAAKQGHPGAQNNLGKIYSSGRGVVRDDLKAYVWFLIAAASGNPKSMENRDIQSQILTENQIELGQNLAFICINNDFKKCD